MKVMRDNHAIFQDDRKEGKRKKKKSLRDPNDRNENEEKEAGAGRRTRLKNE